MIVAHNQNVNLLYPRLPTYIAQIQKGHVKKKAAVFEYQGKIFSFKDFTSIFNTEG